MSHSKNLLRPQIDLERQRCRSIDAGAQGFFTKDWIAYLPPIPKICMIRLIRLFMNRGQISLLTSKSTDLELGTLLDIIKNLNHNLLFMTFVSRPPTLFSLLIWSCGIS